MSSDLIQSMSSLFSLLDKWRHFPAFPLEARSEVLFALFLPTVFEAHFKKDGVKIKPQMVPQFPLRQNRLDPRTQKRTNHSNNVDFFALSEDIECVFLIELKTDMNSWRKEQDCYLKMASKMHMRDILEDLKSIVQASKEKRKYYHLLSALCELGLISSTDNLKSEIFAEKPRVMKNTIDKIRILKSPALKVVYVQPRKPGSEDKQTLVDGFHYIYFDEFAEIVEKQGDMGGLFAGYLRKWKEDPAKYPPTRTEQ